MRLNPMNLKVNLGKFHSIADLPIWIIFHLETELKTELGQLPRHRTFKQ